MSNTCPHTSVEHHIILQALRLDDAHDHGLRTALRQPFQWPQLREITLAQGLQPLVYARLRDAASDLVPADELALLRSQFIYNGQRNLWLASRLLQLLAALHIAGIAAMVIKGPALAIQAYGDLALRDFADLDLLIPRTALAATMGILADLGYLATPPPGTLSFRDKLQADSELHFTDGDAHIDVHWRPIERHLPLALDVTRWFDRATDVDLLGRSIPTLAPADGLLLLCLNGLRDGWTGIKTVVDLAHLYNVASTAERTQLWAQADAIRARRIVALGLALANDLLGLSLDPDSLQRIHADPGVRPLLDEAKARLMVDVSDGAVVYALFRRARERSRDRLACRLTPGPRDWAIMDLPPSLNGLYYLIRPLRLGFALLKRPFVSSRPRHS